MTDGPPIDRRRALGMLGGLSVVALGACSPLKWRDEDPPDDAPVGSLGTVDQDPPQQSITVGPGEIPEESRGAFALDGSNGPNILARQGVVRSDITHSFGGPTGIAEGVAATLALTVRHRVGKKLRPYRGAAVYVWHCDAFGRYSAYDPVIANQNYLRGVQEVDAKGHVTFRTIYPAARPGRWPHVYVMVFESLEAATTGGRPLRTTQIALPQEASRRVYRQTPYQRSLAVLSTASITQDPAFADGHDLQLATVTGDVADRLRIALTFEV
jgi:protocatechuate 3,4-dioxygenase beta subunit